MNGKTIRNDSITLLRFLPIIIKYENKQIIKNIPNNNSFLELLNNLLFMLLVIHKQLYLLVSEVSVAGKFGKNQKKKKKVFAVSHRILERLALSNI